MFIAFYSIWQELYIQGQIYNAREHLRTWKFFVHKLSLTVELLPDRNEMLGIITMTYINLPYHLKICMVLGVVLIPKDKLLIILIPLQFYICVTVINGYLYILLIWS